MLPTFFDFLMHLVAGADAHPMLSHATLERGAALAPHTPLPLTRRLPAVSRGTDPAEAC